MKISVATVCFNASETIAYTIDSFLAQQHPDRELMIIDGGSTDATLEVVQSFDAPEITVISEPDQGMYDAANKALAHFRGDAIGFLNADDRYADRDALSRIVDGFMRSDIVHGNLDFVRDHNSRQVVRQWRSSRFPSGGFRRGWAPAHPTFYVRRAVAESVGRFDLKYGLAADYDWMLRACEMGHFKIGFVDAVLVEMMVGGASTASLHSHIRHNLEALDARRHWLGSGLIDYALFAKPLSKVNQILRPFVKRTATRR